MLRDNKVGRSPAGNVGRKGSRAKKKQKGAAQIFIIFLHFVFSDGRSSVLECFDFLIYHFFQYGIVSAMILPSMILQKKA